MLERNFQMFEEIEELYDDEPEEKAEDLELLRSSEYYQLYSAASLEEGVRALKALGFYSAES